MSDLRIAVLSCSDSASSGSADDDCGRVLIEACEARGWLVVSYHVCPDEIECITTSLLEMTDMEGVDIALTLGGVGLRPRDITPEATARILERPVPGLAEIVRRGCGADVLECALSRGVAGIRGHSLIVNLPGDPDRVQAGFAAVADLFEGAVEMMRGQAES